MSRTLELISSDNMSFHIDEVAGMHMSQYIKLIFEEGWYPDPLSLSMVPSNILPKIIEYCHTHVHGKLTAEELKEFDSKFLNVDRSTLFGLIVGANYMRIKSLLALTCQAVVDMIDETTPKEISNILGIKNDFTPEEVDDLYLLSSWAFE